MMASKYRLVLAAVGVATMCGCATLPSQYAWRPWTRTFENPSRTLPVGARMAITCDGTTEPAFARDIPLRDSLEGACAALLRRRGFGVGEPNPDFTLHIKYATTRQTTMDATSSATSASVQTTTSSTSSGAGTHGGSGGLGVAIAGAFLQSLAASRTNVETSLKSQTRFEQVLAMEIVDTSGSVVWEGNARWDTPVPEVRNGFGVGAKLLFSSLPSKADVEIAVPEVDARHLEIAYWLQCNGRPFSAPGLPYSIGFSLAPIRPALAKNPAKRNRAVASETARIPAGSLPSGIREGAALFAYLDLVSHAEIALPVTYSPGRWDDPLEPKLWARVRLGGSYRLGPSGTPIKVLVTLKGSALTGTYQVSDAHVATESEYVAFQNSLLAWQDALQQYYDVTVH